VRHTVHVLSSWFKDNLVKANIDKFQFMVLCPGKRESGEVTIQIGNDIVLASQDSAKLLGIRIDKELRFDNHVSTLCKKANAKLQIIRRMSNFLSVECKLAVVRCFVLSQFMYCSVLFLFCKKYYKDRMDKIIYRALKVAYNDHSATYDDLLQRCDMDSLELSRQKTLLCEIFKSINNIGPKYMKDIFSIHKQESRLGLQLYEHRVRTSSYGTHSVRALGPRLWNALPPSIKASESISMFKSKLKKFNVGKCRCAICR